MRKLPITIAKYQGDDCYSWAVFVGRFPYLTGLNHRTAAHYRDLWRKDGAPTLHTIATESPQWGLHTRATP